MPVDDPRIDQGIKALARIIADAYFDGSDIDAPKTDDADWQREPRSTECSSARSADGQQTVQLDGFERDSNTELSDQDG